jgi:hypothetical protein
MSYHMSISQRSSWIPCCFRLWGPVTSCPSATPPLPRRLPVACHAPAADFRRQHRPRPLRDGLDLIKACLHQAADRLCVSLQHVEGLLCVREGAGGNRGNCVHAAMRGEQVAIWTGCKSEILQ